MKIKSITLIGLYLTVAAAITITSFMVKASESNEKAKKHYTKEQLQEMDNAKKKVKIMKEDALKDALKDAGKSFDFDLEELEKDFLSLDVADRPKFVNGEVSGFSDLEECKKIMMFVNECFMELTKGDLQPNIYIGKDGKKVIIVYKKGDGTNVLITGTLNNDGKWEKDKKTKSGKEILKFESIKS
ncbi:hypothetical protein [Petroclostridium sp. X23]|uniref:hypothetical protein n=1 Tax=Petroclostridium sp. X23 TaxID=3045146 RepID=UPI0024AD6B9D|nr:hypothetical protein [Petroclostridium sp. X23]WHH57027.1 hypothetical protein QKW49_14370 [Petroclostridium sp. X23]